MNQRITYASTNTDRVAIDAAFDSAMLGVKQKIGTPSRDPGLNLRKVNPSRPSEVIGDFYVSDFAELDDFIEDANDVYDKHWKKQPWQNRVELCRKIADRIIEKRFTLAAVVSLETGKNRLESLGEVEEAADLFRYYAKQVEDNQGYIRPLTRVSPNEHTCSYLKPYGVFLVISPFNFPFALAAGMSAAALLGGNTVILKPSDDAPLSAEYLANLFKEAGFEEKVFQVIYTPRPEVSRALVLHPRIHGVAFTGSTKVGHQIALDLAKRYEDTPCLLEMGGKNPVLICEDADMDLAVEGCHRSAFGFSGQKCSALSRIYLAGEMAKDAFLERFLAKTRTTIIGPPEQADAFMGPVINASARERFQTLMQQVDPKYVLCGGNTIETKDGGYFVEPTVIDITVLQREADRAQQALWLSSEELFLPIVAVETIMPNVDYGILRCNRTGYGLTAGIYSRSEKKVQAFMDNVQAGVLYANRASGATTGAWPGVQSFCGWKQSGRGGKGGCGPYYVTQFMREQSQTINYPQK